MFRGPEADKDLHLSHVLVHLYFLNFYEDKNHLKCSLKTLELKADLLSQISLRGMDHWAT